MSHPPNCVIAVMARAPASDGKSRLIGALGTDDGAGLRLALLRDTLDVLAAIDASKAILYTLSGGDADIREVTPFPALFLPQRGETLGDRMREGIRDLLASFDAVVLVGSDLPTLPARHVTTALDLLTQRPELVVLGPSDDGGYYLIGLTQPRPELFDGMPWSTPLVFRRTCDVADAMRVPISTLPSWYDVDAPEDLRRVWHESDVTPGAGRYTRAWLAAAPAAVRARVLNAAARDR